MTFPVDLLFVSTTNNTNDFRIHKAVANRLVGIPVARAALVDECLIVKKEIAQTGSNVRFPELFLEFIVTTIRALNNIAVYLGPRSSIRAAGIACASALLDGRETVSYCDVKEGLFTEITGQGSDETFEEINEMLSKDFPSIVDFLKQRTPIMENAFAFVDNFGDAETAFLNMDNRLVDDIIAAIADNGRGVEAIKAYLDAYAVACGL
jgi:MoxR-like ATPase